jgi:hypothetical protein
MWIWDLGSGIRDGKNSDSGSGDKYPGSAILTVCRNVLCKLVAVAISSLDGEAVVTYLLDLWAVPKGDLDNC